MITKKFNYLEFEINSTKIIKGFNHWDFTAITYKGNDYCLKRFHSYTSNYKTALNDFKKFLEDCINTGLNFKHNGVLK